MFLQASLAAQPVLVGESLYQCDNLATDLPVRPKTQNRSACQPGSFPSRRPDTNDLESNGSRSFHVVVKLAEGTLIKPDIPQGSSDGLGCANRHLSVSCQQAGRIGQYIG